jgi:hypothetical protein
MEDAEPVGEIGIEREESSVVVVIDEDGEDEERHYLPPEHAAKVAMWLNRAAADAKKFKRQEADS